MPISKETDSKKMSSSIMKMTMDEKNRKRKKQNLDPLPPKKLKIKTNEDIIESCQNEVKKPKIPVHTIIRSELNVLPDYESDTPSESEKDIHDTPQGSEKDIHDTPHGSEKDIHDTPRGSEKDLHDTPQESEKGTPDTPQGSESTDIKVSNKCENTNNEVRDGCNSTEVHEECESTNYDTPIEFEGKQYVEYYVNGYCIRNNARDQYYARNESGDELYWRDSVNAEIYAYKSIKINNSLHKIEYPAIKNDEPSYIYDRAGKPRYPVDLTTQKVIFPRNPDTQEEIYLPDRKGNLFYPENKFGQQFYRKDAEGNEVLLNNTYAQYADGSQIYPKKFNEDQFYLQLGNLEIPAVKRIDEKYVAYYAQKKNGDQIYPREYLDT